MLDSAVIEEVKQERGGASYCQSRGGAHSTHTGV